jgi:hypothetical protein
MWRWVAFSSTAYTTRRGHIISRYALSEDCDRADRSRAYGPLLWWHEPQLVLGDCDFNVMHGRILIESGTFRSARIAQKVAQAVGGLGVSIGFESVGPDTAGVFDCIRRYERSLVPLDKANNMFTKFMVMRIGTQSKEITR